LGGDATARATGCTHRARSFVLGSFRALERQLRECMDFLPYDGVSSTVASPRFASIILEACSLIDSVLMDFVGDRERRDLKRYSQLVEKYLELDGAISIFLNTDLVFLNPFAGWQSRVPEWWAAHNRLKHDRLNNYSLATYQNAVLALAGLHQVISRNRDFIPDLISAGWIHPESPDLPELLMARVAEHGVPIQVIPVESGLFASPLHSSFVECQDGRYLVSDRCTFSPKVTALVTAYEWLPQTRSQGT